MQRLVVILGGQRERVTKRTYLYITKDKRKGGERKLIKGRVEEIKTKKERNKQWE